MAIQAKNAGISSGSGLCWIDNGYTGGSVPFCQNIKQSNFQPIMNHDGVVQASDGACRRTALSFPQLIQYHDERERQEIDYCIRYQNERLRWVIQTQTRQTTDYLKRWMESKALLLLSQKDEAIARASNRAMELETMVKKLEMENQSWQRAAKEKEAMVASLSHTLEQMRGKAACVPGGLDAESCCDDNRDDRMCCKSCGEGIDSCFLFLPCRHLGACKDCVSFLFACPICGVTKQGVVEAIIS